MNSFVEGKRNQYCIFLIQSDVWQLQNLQMWENSTKTCYLSDRNICTAPVVFLRAQLAGIAIEITESISANCENTDFASHVVHPCSMLYGVLTEALQLLLLILRQCWHGTVLPFSFQPLQLDF